MKTDKFEENIRQKLEGIDPPFQESDWLHLRSFLRRNGIPSMGGGAAQWLMPMLSAATVAGLVILTVWQYRTNQNLEQSVRTLRDSVTILQQLPVETPVAVAPKTDTVYITREVPVPGLVPISPKYRSDDRTLAERLETNERESASDNANSTDEQSQGTGENRPRSNGFPERSGTKERFSELENRLNEGERPNPSNRRTESSERNYPRLSNPANSVGDRWNRQDETRYSGRQKPTGFETTRPLSFNGNGDSGSGSGSDRSGSGSPLAESASISWEPVPTRPLEIDSSYYTERFDRRIRRMRASSPRLAASSLLKPEVEKPKSPFVHVRAGASAQIGGRQSGFGFATEVLMGEHLTIGLGLNTLKVTGEKFVNEIQYSFNRRSDFRRDYPGKVPPEIRTQILDINRGGSTLQLPITFGYRIPLGESVTLTPSVGASFSLEAKDKITYLHQVGPFDYIEKKFSEKCTPNVYNSWLVNVAIEKQWGHWVVQASPYLSNPLMSTQFSLNHTSAGMRARLLYQF
ncbi:hypothetical protein [Larkinella rosea]|uniref:Outer membrane protein beta-barrel domain-containing protein n=1 Tax=Larkinella rosea TaxID=2025312 RepID=A0A3P1BJS5_9BACT|nr:hypothetical protein [Larkinella rosea]RRB01186.1 hypothetical protein EHT25_23725 [Larkinella rosea]